MRKLLEIYPGFWAFDSEIRGINFNAKNNPCIIIAGLAGKSTSTERAQEILAYLRDPRTPISDRMKTSNPQKWIDLNKI